MIFIQRALVLLVLCAGVTFQGCVGGPDREPGFVAESGDAEPVQGDWLVMARETDADSLNPIISTNAFSSSIWGGALGSYVGEYLLGYDPDTWRVERPILAESYPEISDDNLTYTFTIRDGIRWHDGEPFTAGDVLFSIKATMLPTVDSAALRGYFADLADVEVDGRVVRFRMDRPYWLNANVLGHTMAIVPEHVFDPDGVLARYSYAEVSSPEAFDNEELWAWGQAFNRHPANRAPIGTGPWKFESWDSGTQMVLTRNEEYWGTKPYLDGIVVRIITDPTASLTALKSGDVDLFPRLTPIQWAQQTSGSDFDDRLTKTTYGRSSFAYIGWNSERPFFADKRVRQALTMLMPRQQMIDTIRFGLGTIAIGPIDPASPDFNSDIEPFPYDPVRAAALLDEAGWVDSNGNGIRDKDGLEFRFEFLGSIGSAFIEQLMPIMKDELGRVGIDMTERRLEFTTIVENARDHQFDALSMQWISDLESDPYQLWHSSSAANRGSNYVGFRNADADRIMEEARAEFDPVRRRELYMQFQEIVHDEQPYTFLFYPEEAAAYSRRFQGVEWIPPFPGFNTLEWYVPTRAQRFSDVSPR